MRKKIQWLIPLLGANLFVNAQLSEIYYNNYQISNAKELYENEAYRGTQYIINDLINFSNLRSYQLEIANFYDALISLILQDEEAEKKFDAFTNKYPQSVLTERAHLQLGNYYLIHQDYFRAAEELSKVAIDKLPPNKRANQYIKLGYAQFMNQDFENAEKNLEKGSYSNQYKNQIDFLLGHIAYANGEHIEAKKKFTSLLNQPEFTEKIKPYMVQIYFNDGEYDFAISTGKTLLASNQYPELKNEIIKIIGESYFKLKKYAEAEPYLSSYIKNSASPTLSDYYQMGYVLYQAKKYEEAVTYFNKITVGDISPISQNAYYQLGNSYLKTNKKKEALTAFKAASEMDFDKKIQENAYLNYAKLSYEVGNPYEPVSKVLNTYLKRYPASKHQSEINELLVKSYINSGNFSEASQLLSSIPNKSSELKLKEQEVAYAYGVQLYNQGKIESASQEFEKAILFKNNSQFYARSLYWYSDCQYQLGNYQNAIDKLQLLQNSGITIPESSQVMYQKGYSYLKLKNFDLAAVSFQEYLKNPKQEFKADAELRLADALLGSNQLNQAIQMYDQAYTSSIEDREYSQYQKAIVYGLQKDYKNKIVELEKLIKAYPKSEKISDAYFELGTAYAETENYQNSNNYFQKVISSSKNNDLVVMSYLGIADNLTSLKEYQKAIVNYGTIADNYPKTDYALQAITGAKTAFIESGKENEYIDWANRKGYNMDRAEAEELSFMSAQKKFLSKDYSEASQEFATFLTKFPTTSRKITSLYYLGESYFQLANYNQALEALKEVSESSNEFQEDALVRLSQIYIKQEKDEAAQNSLESLYKITSNQNYKSFAELELMYIYSDHKEYTKANEMAVKVLNNSKNPSTVKEQATLIKARSLYNSGKTNEAKSVFTTLEQSKNNAVKAEALYYNALLKNKDKKYDASNSVIFNLTSKYSDQQYWGAKALLIMSNNYLNLKDNYQATYILEQIIENYKEFPDVVQDAQTQLNHIK
ncbi:tetratricopeptide repeat protein [Apibacter sp. B3889]|uniref:tetratricopeptide repeat protein n=1 Tax=unclassified Apibacter TaxID=2630820 RepID=UPI001327DAF0|nr:MULTISPECIES: tetratricopeptide repeat protein [unclassified Apibacter]MXO34716.1 tetratricopeptide repeat protein [Apibacter sp. B3883]MXO42180.1 tetratricopeptide repeat protein [Apibacter sp. B3889]MXP03750.1 tetratricopeptide repeat protein [Apibacter sp. B3887]MXP08014.1 tetratricopeptide repeat protein [Apibacter sp. B3935]